MGYIHGNGSEWRYIVATWDTVQVIESALIREKGARALVQRCVSLANAPGSLGDATEQLNQHQRAVLTDADFDTSQTESDLWMYCNITPDTDDFIATTNLMGISGAQTLTNLAGRFPRQKPTVTYTSAAPYTITWGVQRYDAIAGGNIYETVTHSLNGTVGQTIQLPWEMDGIAGWQPVSASMSPGGGDTFEVGAVKANDTISYWRWWGALTEDGLGVFADTGRQNTYIDESFELGIVQSNGLHAYAHAYNGCICRVLIVYD